MFRKTKIFILGLILLISVWPAKADAAFNEGSGYEEGKYKETAQHPMGTSWSKNSQYTSVNAKESEEIFKTENKFTVNPLVDTDGTIYIATSDRKLYALDSNGNIKWSKDVNSGINGMALYTDGNLVYNDSTINMVDAKTGKDVWAEPINIGSTRMDTNECFKGAPVIDKEGHIIVAHSNGLYAFNGNGTMASFIKDSSNSNFVVSGVSIDNKGTIYYPNNYINTYKLVDNKFVKLYDQYSVDGSSIRYDSITLMDDGNIFFYRPGTSLGRIINIGNKTSKDVKMGVSTAPVTMEILRNATVYNKDQSIYVPFTSHFSSDNLNFLNKYDKNGNLIWSHNTMHKITSTPVIDANGNVLFVEKGKDNYLTSVSADNNTNWTVKLIGASSEDITTPVIMKDGSILVKVYNKLYRVTGEQSAEEEPNTSTPPEDSGTQSKLITVFNDTNKYNSASFNDKSSYTVYEYTEKKEDWYKIITAPNHTKWINGTNAVEGEMSIKEQTVEVTRDSYGYSQPFFYSKKTGDALKKGDKVQVVATVGDWYLTKVNEKDVWFNQKETNLTIFTRNNLYDEADLSTWTNNAESVAPIQTLIVKDMLIGENGLWYKVQSWLGDKYTVGEQAGLGSIQDIEQTYKVDGVKAYESPFAETAAKTLDNETVTLVAKWQNWYKTSTDLWIKIQ
ncbi:PQQ-binding-like beta-propeller repeat protein [Priestia filamentosa]|uniref:outer membrane protein assembly factor BamB family protein n=1 Tax=Priestia filamentosa TaxID=1402861 RepID=UPI003982270B